MIFFLKLIFSLFEDDTFWLVVAPGYWHGLPDRL